MQHFCTSPLIDYFFRIRYIENETVCLDFLEGAERDLVRNGGKPLNDEMRKRIKKAAEVLRESGAGAIFVFGSAARDEMSEDSDVDMAVTGLPPHVFYKAMGKAGDALGRPLDLIDLDEETPFTRYLKEEGELQLVE